jgi:PPOX class probable FMN-dependent enzyme
VNIAPQAIATTAGVANSVGMSEHAITTKEALRAVYRAPSPLSMKKTLRRIDRHCRRFIELSPFLCLGTADAAGHQDVSPRGDAPGFVQVLDEHTLLLPDRPGNNKLDTLGNILEHAEVALMFVIPGIEDVLRVNGTARLSRDPALLARCAGGGKLPATVMLITVREAFLHCGKALRRSGLWTGAHRARPGTDLPTAGKMLADHIADGITEREVEDKIEESFRERMY